ncbi:MAG: FeoB-associated Cys-rich membrane protein [Epulopiscium sp.]|nr:FeoB-associated Cys-rich membrane protein [Candidatus Epulonipiscium sp.]
MGNIIVILVLASIVALAIRSMWNSHKNKHCGGDCSCCGGSCNDLKTHSNQ